MPILTVIQGGKPDKAKDSVPAPVQLAVYRGLSRDMSLDEMLDEAQAMRDTGVLPERADNNERPRRRDTNYCNDISDAELRRLLLKVKVVRLNMTLAEILEEAEEDLANPLRPGKFLTLMSVLLECGLILVASLPEQDLACRAYYDFSQNCLFFEKYPEFKKYQSRVMAPDFYLA